MQKQVTNYKAIINDRLLEKSKRSKAQVMMVNLLIITSAIIFLSMLFIWIAKQTGDLEAPKIIKWITLILLGISLLLEKGLQKLRRDKIKQAEMLVTTALLMGLGFALMQFLTWLKISHGQILGPEILAPVVLVHLLHVLIGLILLTVVRARISDYQIHSRDLRYAKQIVMYWHYLDVVWISVLLIF